MDLVRISFFDFVFSRLRFPATSIPLSAEFFVETMRAKENKSTHLNEWGEKELDETKRERCAAALGDS
jgi:hypothetical protein